MYHRRLLTGIVLFVLFPLCSFGVPNVLKGKVTDMRGLPLPGAIVEIADLKTGTAADADGNYKISDLPKGTFLVAVHTLNYNTLNEQVTINGETIKDFKLSESVVEKNEVVVTGTSLATEERKSLTPIQSLSIQEMHENASSNVIDALATLPGVSEITTGPAVSKPVIRGLSYNRIITLSDGVRQEGQQWGDEHGIEIDDYNVTRAEVLKGPASLAYGSDALAGVVNIISDQSIPEGKILGNITTNYQTNDGLAALHAHVGGKQDNISWNVYATEKMAHDYQNKYDGYVFDSRFQNTDYGARVGINKKWGSSTLSFTSFNEKLGIPEGERDSATGKFLKAIDVNGREQDVIVNTSDNTSYKMTVPYQHIQHQKLVWSNDLYLGNGGRIGLVLGYQVNTRKEFGDVTAPDVPGLSLNLQTFTYDLKYYLPEWKGWQVTTGINGMSQWNKNKNANEFLVPDYTLFDGGAYGIAKKDIDKWTISGGLRYDVRMIDAYRLFEDAATGQYVRNYEVFHSFMNYYNDVSGSIGVGYNLNKQSILKFNLASGYRAPNIAELSANGVHEGTIRYEIGNNGLKAEHSLQADLGLSWASEHVLVNVSVFDNYVKDFIFVSKLQSVNGGDSIPAINNSEGYAAFRYAQADANLYGGEFNIDLHPHPLDWLHLENTFSYVRGLLMQPIDGTRNLPYMPPARWLIELRAQKKSIGKMLKNAYAKAGIDINFAQNNVYTAYGTETPTPAYTLIDAGIGADFVNKKQHTIFTLTLAGQNLGDVAYQNALNRLRYAPENYTTGRMGIFNMGRNFSVMLSIPLDIK